MLDEQLEIVYQKVLEDKKILPIKVTQFYQKKVDEELNALGHSFGPLYRMVYPTPERLQLKQDNEVDDFVDDRRNMPLWAKQYLVHKYDDRLLYLPHSNCLSNCMYCFRQDVLHEQAISRDKEKKMIAKSLSYLQEYLQIHPEIHEVILSGGDPLMLPPEDLNEICECISRESQVRSIRLHTRAIVFDPKIMSVKKINILRKYQVRIVFHITHPYEICEIFEAKVNQLNREGLRLYNQFPILRKVNDHSQLLIAFLEQLDQLNIRNLSIFFPDPVHYSAAFRIPFKRLFKIMDEIQWNTPAWINSTRFCQDTPYGKVRRDDLVDGDLDKSYVLFKRKGQIIKVPNLPLEMDEAGELNTMLWKGLNF